MGINPGVGYTSSNLGSAYSLDVDQSIDWSSRNVGRQFECSLSGKKVGNSAEYYLQVRKGLIEFDYYGTDDKGILDIDSLGGFSGTNTQNMFFYANKFNVFPTGSRTTGSNITTSDYISDGYIKLAKEKNYFVFIYKTTPDWQQSGNLYEARAPQIAVAEDDSEANIFIKTQRNGGGLLQSYTRLQEVELVVADPETGKIAEIDLSELNQHITFHAEELKLYFANNVYPAGMESWLSTFATGDGGAVPVFAKPSVDVYPPSGPDQMTVDNVPSGCGFRDNYVIGTVDVTAFGTGLLVNYSAGEDDCGNGIVNNVIVGWDVGTLYAYTTNPIVSGVLDLESIQIGLVDNGGQPNVVVEFDDEKLSLFADNTSDVKLAGENMDEGVGYITTDCYRQDIAYIKWDASLNRFKLYQMQYGPIKLRQNPVGLMKNKILTTEEEEAKWDTGFDLCKFITGSLGGSTKDLNTSTSATQPPLYAGYENIGNYQNPKETL